MKQLKYLMLFEAFDSIQLNKTMKFVKKEQKPRLLSALASIAKSIDAPLSSLNDDNFQYLPYKKAIALNSSTEKVDCGACGGEGKITKAWGTGTRRSKCASCDGTGKVDPKPKPKYFKFWLNSEGDFIGTTLTDGLYHENKSDEASYVKKDITEDIKSLSTAELKQKYKIANGETTFLIQNAKSRRFASTVTSLGKGFIDAQGRFFIINSGIDYDQPAGRKWKEYGRYAADPNMLLQWDYNDQARIYLMQEKTEKESILWNLPVSFSEGKWSKSSSDTKGFLKDAQFAIVFDFESFSQNKSFMPVSITKGDRSDARKGATALISDDDIKTANIERYAKSLSNIDLSEGLTRLINKIPKIFGGDLALYYIYNKRNFSWFKNVMALVYGFMESSTTDEQRKAINEELSSRVKSCFDNSESANKIISGRVAHARESLSSDENFAKLFAKLDEMSKKINQKLLKRKIETIEDMEIMLIMAQGINTIIESSDRFKLTYEIKNFLAYIENTGWRGPTASYDYLKTMDSSDFPAALREIDMIIKIIEKM